MLTLAVAFWLGAGIGAGAVVVAWWLTLPEGEPADETAQHAERWVQAERRKARR